MKIFILEYVGKAFSGYGTDVGTTDIYPGAYLSLEDALRFVTEDSEFPGKIIISCVSSDVLLAEVKPVARMATYKGV
jgi:hypothetical protein